MDPLRVLQETILSLFELSSQTRPSTTAFRRPLLSDLVATRGRYREWRPSGFVYDDTTVVLLQLGAPCKLHVIDCNQDPTLSAVPRRDVSDGSGREFLTITESRKS